MVAEKVRVSVIMAVRNEAKFIRKTLDAVLGQTYPKNSLEIIISDGLSDDGTREILDEYAQKDPRMVILKNPGRIVSSGLNLAIQKSTGEILVRVDGHTIIEPDYVEKCVYAILESKADGVGGKMNAVGEAPFPKAVALATSTPLGVGNARFHYSDKKEWVDTVYLGAWRKDIFQRIGLFDETLVRNQDDEFHYRIREHGGKILLSPEIRSIYYVRSNWKALASQYFQYGFWKVRVFQKHPKQMQLRHFAPPGLVFVFLLAAVWAVLFPETGTKVFLGTAGSYLGVLTAGTLWTSRRWANKPVLALIPIYATLHLSYGAGFLCGICRFASEWRKK